MALFIHLTTGKDVDAIRRTGLKPRRITWLEGIDRAVYAMPVVPDYYVSHQWIRELRRGGQRTIVGIYFRIRDEQQVMVGHYRGGHQAMSAAEAVGLIFNATETEGFEVLIPRKVEADEIHRIAEVPQVLGWRFYPEAKGRKPCSCEFCTKGQINSRRLRD